MLITRLCEFAKRESLVDDPAFERRPVAWVLVVDDDGRPIELARTQGELDRRGNPRPKETAVPKVGNRNDGKTPCFAADTLTRVVPGWAERTADEQAKKKGRKVEPKKADLNTRENFVGLIRVAAEETDHLALLAVSRFYDYAAASPAALEPLHEKLIEEKAKPADWITFRRYADVERNLLDFDEVRKFWIRRHAEAAEQRRGKSTRMRCLSCGQVADIAQTHGKLKGIPGGNPAGVSLVSSDKNAFGSYGLAKSLTGPTCSECVEAYTRALNELLSRRTTNYREGDVAFCFWTRRPTDDDWTVLTRAEPEQVQRLLHSPRSPSGHDPDVDDNEFYAISLSGVGGRAMVREWIEETVPRVRENLRDWFADLAIVLDRPLRDDKGNIWSEAGEVNAAWPLWQLVRAVGRRGDRGTEVAPQLPAVLFAAAVRGRPVPESALAAAVRRILAEHGVPPARAALLRLVINRMTSRSPLIQGDSKMSEGLDVTRADPAYLCGRMLAVFARLQHLALGPTNATIVDRYYGAASTAPVTVFGQLVHLAQSHLKKLAGSRKGAAVNIEKDIEEILSKLGQWPRQLPLQEQAVFALGYYHQRAEYRQRPKDKGGSEGDEPFETAAEELPEAS